MYYRVIAAAALFFSMAVSGAAQEGRGQVLPFMAHVVPPVQTVTPNPVATAVPMAMPQEPSQSMAPQYVQQAYCAQTDASGCQAASYTSCDCPECSGEQSWWKRFCDDCRDKRRDWRKNIWMWSYSHHQDNALQHPKCPPHYEPYWGYHQDCWRKFPPGSYCCPPHLTTPIEISFPTNQRPAASNMSPVLAPPPVEEPMEQAPPKKDDGPKKADPFQPKPPKQVEPKKGSEYEPVTHIREEIKGSGLYYYLANPEEPEWRPSR
ncbi:hypothetical protein [Thalassoroseus pseudoceratinae]|uniref:hypothetical protein n=1 Tax=Thalassoroseus pseudoceratinae TaxID=2713176 RepID=UPI00141E7FE0|nr:hypothetical protein [Thalassoroseus pseudoceratinae]